MLIGFISFSEFMCTLKTYIVNRDQTVNITFTLPEDAVLHAITRYVTLFNNANMVM